MKARTNKKRARPAKRGSQAKTNGKPLPLEGEGSYTAARRYNTNLAREIAKGAIARGAELALRALSGPEGGELRRAERSAKRGPKSKRVTSSGRSRRSA